MVRIYSRIPTSPMYGNITYKIIVACATRNVCSETMCVCKGRVYRSEEDLVMVDKDTMQVAWICEGQYWVRTRTWLRGIFKPGMRESARERMGDVYVAGNGRHGSCHDSSPYSTAARQASPSLDCCACSRRPCCVAKSESQAEQQ